ncbi:hypothetical protein [Priestia aryabhattai]|uniref:hypothetical protein n=1 Tax=Priestia aryabhattai TaxID=412384 RepID=UPI0008DD8FCD|nr:hypothetical protein [Priestia aryabhattai]OHY73459.1 hypothetical protein BCV52_26640 [Priestia aryabhattai]
MAHGGLLHSVEGGLLSHGRVLSPCSGSACANFDNLALDTEITVIMDSGDSFFGIFKGFNSETCTAILQYQNFVTPPSTTNILIDCTKVAAIALGPIA